MRSTHDIDGTLYDIIRGDFYPQYGCRRFDLRLKGVPGTPEAHTYIPEDLDPKAQLALAEKRLLG